MFGSNAPTLGAVPDQFDEGPGQQPGGVGGLEVVSLPLVGHRQPLHAGEQVGGPVAFLQPVGHPQDRPPGLQGTPGFLVGSYMVNQALTYEGFVRVASDARARAKKAK